MKILFLSDTFPPQSAGGADVVAFNLAHALHNLGHEVAVVSTSQNKAGVSCEKENGILVWRIYANYHPRWRAYLSLYNPQTVPEIKKIIKAFHPDVVHAHNIHQYLSYHSLKIAKKCGAKVFLTAHDVMLFHYGKLAPSPEEQKAENAKDLEHVSYKTGFWRLARYSKKRFNPLRNICIRNYLRFVNKIFAVSEFIKKALADNGIFNVAVIHNGTNVSAAPKEQAIKTFREKHGIQDSDRVVFFGGRLSGQKGGEQIVRAMEKVQRSVPLAKLVVAGNREGYAEKMWRLAEDLKISRNVVFAGWLSQEDMDVAYGIADVCVAPSIYFEPFGMMALESMAHGKPVVAGIFGGMPEAVIDGVTGYVVNPLRVSDLAEKIILLLQDDALARQMGERGLERIKNNLSQDRQVQKSLEHYSRD